MCFVHQFITNITLHSLPNQIIIHIETLINNINLQDFLFTALELQQKLKIIVKNLWLRPTMDAPIQVVPKKWPFSQKPTCQKMGCDSYATGETGPFYWPRDLTRDILNGPKANRGCADTGCPKKMTFFTKTYLSENGLWLLLNRKNRSILLVIFLRKPVLAHPWLALGQFSMSLVRSLGQ